MILGKICATTHALTLGGRAALAWGPTQRYVGLWGLMRATHTSRDQLTVMTLTNNEISRFISVYTVC